MGDCLLSCSFHTVYTCTSLYISESIECVIIFIALLGRNALDVSVVHFTCKEEAHVFIGHLLSALKLKCDLNKVCIRNARF